MGRRPHVIPAIIAVVMLLAAVAPLPYGYYQFLRWVICGISIFIAVEAYSWGRKWATWLFAPIAVLFNPLIPIHLTKEIWQPIDLACALLFALSLLFLAKPAEEQAIEDREAREMSYIGNYKTRIYHYKDCQQAYRISDENIVYFQSIADAESEGYKPCNVCKP